MLTVANGGDNVGIYIPLFATASAEVIVTTLVIFYVMLVAWLALAYSLTRCPGVAEIISTYGHYVIPLVLMGLGLYILSSTVIWVPGPGQLAGATGR